MLLEALVAAAVLSGPAATKIERCAPVTEAEVAALFDRWNASLATSDPDKVIANYAPDAILLPTVSNLPRFTQQERRAYFVDFLKNRPNGRIDERRIQIGCNTAVDAGLYTFTMEATGAVVQARFTYTYVKHGDAWLISSHHSSMMPERPLAALDPAGPSPPAR